MKNVFLAFGVLIALSLAVYFSGAYTYFQERTVTEDLPLIETPETQASEAEEQTRIIKEGTFVDADFFHTGEGTAKIIAYPDGTHILRFEEFSVVNGPDVYVYLTSSTTPTGDLESLGDYLDLGLLKGNVGNQNYELPLGAEEYGTVALWCKKFGALFPYAVMTTPAE